MVAVTLLIWSEVALFFSIVWDVVLHLVSPDTSSIAHIAYMSYAASVALGPAARIQRIRAAGPIPLYTPLYRP